MKQMEKMLNIIKILKKIILSIFIQMREVRSFFPRIFCSIVLEELGMILKEVEKNQYKKLEKITFLLYIYVFKKSKHFFT